MLNFLKTKIGTVVLSLALVGVGFLTLNSLLAKYRIDKQIRQLQARADQVQGQNQSLSDLVNYLNTDQYKEKVAREQLNLKKDGEYVVALPQNQQEQVAAASTETQKSNTEKWFNYFFKK